MLNSCEKAHIVNNNKSEFTPLEKVQSFLDAKNKKATFDDLNIQESVWYIEAVLNYQYGQNHEFYQNNILDSIEIVFALNEVDMIESELLFEIYDELASDLDKLIVNGNKSNEYFNISLIDLESEIENNILKLYIGISYGDDSKLCGTSGPPFSSSQYWDYDDGGKCGSYSGCSGTGAKIIFETYLNAMYGTYPAGCWFTHVGWTMLLPQQQYPLFASYESCMTPYNMNLYFNNTHQQAVKKTPKGKKYYYLTMYAYDDTTGVFDYFSHEAQYRYGTLNYSF